MVEMDQLQKEVFDNKIKKGFNTKDIYLELCLLSHELSEAFMAYHRKEDGVGEELADVAIYLLGLSEMLGISLEKEILRKIEINKNREYVRKNGVLVKKDS